MVCRASNNPISGADSTYTACILTRLSRSVRRLVRWGAARKDVDEKSRPDADPYPHCMLPPGPASEDVLSQLERDGLVESIAALRAG